MGKAQTKIKTEAVAAVQTRDQAEKAMQEIAVLQQQLKRQQADQTDKINAIKTAAQQAAAPINDKITELFKGLHVFAEAHKGDLLKGRSKTVKMGAGDMGWRTNPPKCSIRGEQAVVESLERLKLLEAIREKKTVAKDVILNDPDKYRDVKGITIKQDEEFFVKPHETEVEQVEVVK